MWLCSHLGLDALTQVEVSVTLMKTCGGEWGGAGNMNVHSVLEEQQ